MTARPLSAAEAATGLSAPEFTPLAPPSRPAGRTGPPPSRPVDRDIPFEIDENGCFVLTGYLKSDGYGVLKIYGTRTTAHRAIWLDTVGQIPDGMHLDHLCSNPACINADHLEVVTPRENVLRSRGVSAQLARRTHCRNGHEFTPETTGRRSDGSRICRICKPARRAQIDAPHGTYPRYRSGCRCLDCRTTESRRMYASRYRDRQPVRHVSSLANPRSRQDGVA